MPQIIPIRDLRDTNTISEKCHTMEEPIFITKNGYGDLVVMSIETYDKLINTNAIDMAIREAEQEMAQHAKLENAREVLPALRRKYLD